VNFLAQDPGNGALPPWPEALTPIAWIAVSLVVILGALLGLMLRIIAQHARSNTARLEALQTRQEAMQELRSEEAEETRAAIRNLALAAERVAEAAGANERAAASLASTSLVLGSMCNAHMAVLQDHPPRQGG
jgi:hypothetical protein